jgi:hypothetical protein
MSLCIAEPGDPRRAMALGLQVERPHKPALASASIDDECAVPGSRFRLDASNAIASDDWMQLIRRAERSVRRPGPRRPAGISGAMRASPLVGNCSEEEIAARKKSGWRLFPAARRNPRIALRKL